MKFSVTYLPTALFSLKDSGSTNSGAKSLLLPSPYAIKMAILNQAILIGGDLDKLQEKKSICFEYIKDAIINYYIEDETFFAVNNSFVKILKPEHSGNELAQTVAFREYVFISKPIEIIFEFEQLAQKEYLQKYLHNINYFGKKGCFFQFLKYSDNPNQANVKLFEFKDNSFGLLQSYDDFDGGLTFDNVNNYSVTRTKRKSEIMILPLQCESSSKSFSLYKKQ